MLPSATSYFGEDLSWLRSGEQGPAGGVCHTSRRGQMPSSEISAAEIAPTPDNPPAETLEIPTMLPLAVVQEVRRRLEEGVLSQRQIAQQLGMSRGTVGAIASGRRGESGRQPERDQLALYGYLWPPRRCPGAR